MILFDNDVLEQMREGYRNRVSPCDLLRQMIQLLPSPHHKLDLIGNIRAAFTLSLNEASCIGGWEADGSGELNDAKIDGFLSEAIDRHRSRWDSTTVNS